jgi:hypothetical protein
MNNEYEPLLLSTQELLNRHWPIVEPMLRKCEGDYNTEDMFAALLRGEMFIFVIAKETIDGPDVALAVLMQPLVYPRRTAMNIVAVAGKDLRKWMRKYWGFLYAWAFMNGARAIESPVPPAVERLLGGFGFKRTAIYVSTPLTGNAHSS